MTTFAGRPQADATRPEEVQQAPSLCAVFQDTVRERPDAVALRAADGQLELSWREYGERVRRIAAGLAALGVRRGDTVALMLTNRPEFHLVDVAVTHLGATPFSIYNTSSPEQIEYLFSTAGNRVVVCEEQFLDRIGAVAEQSGIERIVCVDAAAEGALSLEQVEAAGEAGFDFEAAWRAVGRDDVATLIFTSGTTGRPKAVELSHGNVLYSTSCILRTPETLGGSVRGGLVLSYLPDAHQANRLFAHYVPVATGATVVDVRDGRTVVKVAQEVHPTMFVSVPAIWYKLKAAAEQLVAAGHAEPAQVPATLGLDKVVAGVSGGAPIAADALEYFASLGIPVIEGWAMSETAGAGIWNPPSAIKPGTVGLPVPGTEIKVGDDGELLVRSPGVMRGYRNDPERTAEAIDSEGWLHTGDIVTVDDDGYVTIVDRKKELIITSGGKNISPANIENAVKTACSLAGSVAAIGDGRKYLTALVTLDPDVAGAFAAANEIADTSPEALARDAQVQAAVAAGVEQANATLSRPEQIKAFTILPGYWLPDSDELTPTMKLKRKVIGEKYAAEIEELYTRAR